MTRAQKLALMLFAVLFLIAVAIVTFKVLGSSTGFDLDQLPD